MNSGQKNYEVETRFRFKNKQEVFTVLPFIESCFTSSNVWHTVHYGFELFKRDVILRINESRREGKTKMALGWKSPDFGDFVNIREELDEDITNGISDSTILAMFGINSKADSVAEVIMELNRLGCPAFMEFNGNNEFGFYSPLGLQLKLMHCSLLQYPYMLEIEKTAHNFEEAFKMEEELLAFTDKYQLRDLEVKAEPPTLLYQACCSKTKK
jgi:hypothetical protein